MSNTNKRNSIIIVVVVLAALGIWFGVSRAREGASGNGDTTVYTNDQYGFSFKYPEKYFLEEHKLTGTSTEDGTKLLDVVLIEDTPTNRSIVERTNETATEGPIAITISVYENNNEHKTLSQWIRTNENSNFRLSNGTYASTTVAQKEALIYEWSGLYEGMSTIFEHANNILMASVTRIAPTDTILEDYERIMNSMSFK